MIKGALSRLHTLHILLKEKTFLSLTGGGIRVYYSQNTTKDFPQV